MLGYRADLAPEKTLQSTPFRYANSKPPPSKDWRAEGAVTPVKNQEQVTKLINCNLYGHAPALHIYFAATRTPDGLSAYAVAL